jgi:hypothetical protein
MKLRKWMQASLLAAAACSGEVLETSESLPQASQADTDAGRAPPDAGTPDSGPAVDSGTPAEDAGVSPLLDAGRPTRDAGEDAGTHPDTGCDAGALLCEGFETYSGLPAGIWTANISPTPTSTFLVDSTKPYSGTQSLHIHSAARSDVLSTTTGLPPPNDHVFGRMMLFLKSPWPTTHIRLMRLQGTNPLNAFALNGGSTFRFEGLVDKFGGDGAEPVTPHLDKWVCVEWEINGQTPTQANLWLDGTEVLPAPTGLPPVDIVQLEIGFSSATDPPFASEMWIDDLILSTRRVGCPP